MSRILPVQPFSAKPSSFSSRVTLPRIRRQSRNPVYRRLIVWGFLGWLSVVAVWTIEQAWHPPLPSMGGLPVPLEMDGGDPYIRALMRTISASESHDPNPYGLLYGGSHVEDLSRHPDRCIPIRHGPNRGQCSTAAGRYQFITTTWLEKADLYHPAPRDYAFWTVYSFEPEFQDEVVYAWLTDPYAWDGDLATLLRDGQLEVVLEQLSDTWTSLGYGIETNRRTPMLPHVYEAMLEEEIINSQESDVVDEGSVW